MPNAVVLQTTKNAFTFRPNYGFYYKHLHELANAKYNIRTIAVDDESSIKTTLKTYHAASIGFLWIRMHGTPTSMEASDKLTITTENMDQIFEDLSNLLTDNAVIFLDSCHTGDLDSENMQIAFAKLTIEKACHLSYFDILPDGSFRFEMIANPYFRSENITVILGHHAKAIIKKWTESNASYDSIKEELHTALLLPPKHCPFIESFMEDWAVHMADAGFDLTTLLMAVIKTENNTEKVLRKVSTLVEKYHASPNFPEVGYYPFLWEHVSSLSCAIYFRYATVANYLIKHGASLSETFKGESLLEFAKRRDGEESLVPTDMDDDDFDWVEYRINKRRKKEGDTSQMSDIIQYCFFGGSGRVSEKVPSRGTAPLEKIHHNYKNQSGTSLFVHCAK
jgi:hypothetical protein